MKIKIRNFNDKTGSLPVNSEIKVFKRTGNTESLLDIEDLTISSTFDGRIRQYTVNIYVSDTTSNPQ